jgi:hypothetical protein|tara:strand:- start:162 stop:404 length:243 start_codon:yes stop_codon:yes gene_type:complete
MINRLFDDKNNLVKEKLNLINKLKLLEKDINNKNYEIANHCKIVNNSHKWITERKGGIYGEKITYCKICKIDLYQNSFHH